MLLRPQIANAGTDGLETCAGGSIVVTGNHRSYRRPYPQRLLATLDLFAEDDSFLSLAVAGPAVRDG